MRTITHYFLSLMRIEKEILLMFKMTLVFSFILFYTLLFGCATVTQLPTAIEAPMTRAQQQEAQKASYISDKKFLKRKIAIARFTNETRYGRTFLRDKDRDPLGKQASDILANQLVASKKFLVFERSDISKIETEQKMINQSNLIGVDTLILGSVTEFGRSITGQSGFLSSTKKQIARAKVEIRLVDTRTGHLFFSARGVGEAMTESGRIAGFGSKADYDATLNDKAISAAISDVLSDLIAKLEARAWWTDIIKVQGKRIFISGGKHQGVTVGDELAIMRPGEKVISKQTGFKISLPPFQVARIRIIALFGDSETNEGAVGEMIEGRLSGENPENLFVGEL